ncbi:hypothetical protein Lesp02_73980 [Lentzea sp. NBRC 105346]|uniref:hypothetical protein n=1 Tax=Lentzea sp. NBRC 105346 TaxID=3032205 RepID=UPI0024A08E32|nr:hypothetical protein [Lentzea sp. NBRC 105346]GLZ35211.1 hypothetical protein Lesp02_73980 [Lentzea sp. NBRC 105346]
MTSALQEALAEPAAQARARFAGRLNGYLDGSDVVHAVRMQAWLGLEVPGPGCHVGTGSWDFTRFKATTSPVSCGRCRSAGLLTSSFTGGPHQQTLDLEGLTW